MQMRISNHCTKKSPGILLKNLSQCASRHGAQVRRCTCALAKLMQINKIICITRCYHEFIKQNAETYIPAWNENVKSFYCMISS